MAVIDRLGFLMTDPTIRSIQVPLDHDPLRAAFCLWGEGYREAEKTWIFKLVSWLQLIYPAGFPAKGVRW